MSRARWGVFLPQYTHTTSFKDESRALSERLADPAHGKRAEDVAVRDEEDVTVASRMRGLANDGLVPILANLVDNLVQTLGDVLGTPSRRGQFPSLSLPPL